MNQKFTEHTYLEIRDKIAADWHAILPSGCTEQQGPHLPVGFDSKFAERLAIDAAALCSAEHGINYLALPALPFGPTPEHRDFGSGYIDLPHELHEKIIFYALKSLAEQGFRRIVVWRGCGEHRLERSATQFNKAFAPRSVAFLPELPYERIWEEYGEPSVAGGHADSFCTSIAMYHWPESVRSDRIYCPEQTPVNWESGNINFKDHTESGVIGDPTHASRALGERLWQKVVEEVAEILKDPERNSVV